MHAQGEVLSFFPTPIWTFDLPEAESRPFNQRLLAAIDGLVQPRPTLDWGESWQTAQDLHRRPEFRELTALIGGGVREALGTLDVAYDVFEITACWANVSASGAWHRPHRHPNNCLSGVYYAHTGAGADEIHFHEPRPQAGMIAPRPKHENVFNADKVILDAHDGRLVVFPAWLSHSVPPNRSENERVSISFNIALRTTEGDLSKPRWEGDAISDVKTAPPGRSPARARRDDVRRPFVTLPAVVTHNFDPARGALRNVCDLADAAVEAVLDGIRATGTARLSPGYLARRRRTEAWLLAACTRKLGVPPLPRPLYFFLGDFDDGLDPSRPASLVLPLALFPADALTFTWPDSMVSVEANGHPWRGQVFTLAEVEAQVATHGLPGRGDEDPFIEVQVWDDAPLRGLALP